MEAFMYDSYSEDYVFRLIEAGCDIFANFDDRSTLLHWAVGNDWIQVAECLIEHGLNVNGQNSKAETPLHWACERGLIDEIWMLLFFGADPNIKADYLKIEKGWCVFLTYLSLWEPFEVITCFDIAACSSDKPEVQEIFLHKLEGYEKNFSLKTFIKALEGKSLPFPHLVEIASGVNYNEPDAKEFLCTIKDYPEFFTLFIKKFDFVIQEIFETYEIDILDCEYFKNLEAVTKNLLALFDSTVADTLVDQIHAKDSLLINYIIDIFDYTDNSLEAITQLICCMLSYGVDLNALAIHQIYFKYGYCDLFEILLHMDLSKPCNYDITLTDSFFYSFESHLDFTIFASRRLPKLKNLMCLIIPKVIYDVKIAVPSLIRTFVPVLNTQYDPDLVRNIIFLVFANFALREPVKASIFDLTEYGLLFENDELKSFMDPDKYPVVPMLMELCRKRVREIIIKTYRPKNNVQYYKVLQTLPIQSDFKDIISFKRTLYPLCHNH